MSSELVLQSFVLQGIFNSQRTRDHAQEQLHRTRRSYPASDATEISRTFLN